MKKKKDIFSNNQFKSLNFLTFNSKIYFSILLIFRLLSAFYNHISDCDETFNYWEPISFLTLGNGMQTWEYSPQYAIRSYLYLWFYALPTQLLLLFVNKLMVFYLIRCLLAIFCFFCEYFFFKGVRQQLGNQIANNMVIFLAFSPGMFNSSTAVLPSTFSMHLTMLIFSGFFLNRHHLSLLAIGLSALVGWPFSAIIGLIVLFELFRKTGSKTKFWWLVKWGVIYATIITTFLIIVDSFYYCKFVLTPLNIIMYNVFSKHGANLYGVEPASFYFINLILNFNLVFLFAILAFPLSYLHRLSSDNFISAVRLASLVFYLWMIIFSAQAHKEERFLFPIYPLICLLASIAINQLKNSKYHKLIFLTFFTIFLTLSLSRILAIYTGYHAPLETFAKLKELDSIYPLTNKKQVVCLGKEWYRYPSSFFLPNSNWQLGFLPSSFQGQLPQPFSNLYNASCITQKNFNDLNLEEISRYVTKNDCDYIIDSDFSETHQRDPNYSRQTKDWSVIFSTKILDPNNSSRILRAFYIPFLSSCYNSYVPFNLLRNLNKH